MSKMTKRWLSIVTTLAVAFTMCFGCMGEVFAIEGQVEEGTTIEEQVQPEEGFADEQGELEKQELVNEETEQPGANLTVQADSPDLTVENGSNKRFFKVVTNDVSQEKELFECNAQGVITDGAQAMKTYRGDYSARKNTGTEDSVTGCYGPSIIELVKTVASDSELKNASLTFTDGSFDATVAWAQIVVPRYSFTSIIGTKDEDMGKAVTSDEKGTLVEPIVDLNFSSSKGNTETTIGQLSSSDRNKPAFVGGVAAGGKIIVNVNEAKTLTAESVELKKSVVGAGEKIEFSYKGKSEEKGVAGSIYYDFNGYTPTMKSAIYNYDTKKGNDMPFSISTYGVYDIHVKVMGPGGLDSSEKVLKLIVADKDINKEAIALSTTSYVYNGKSKIPAVSVNDLSAGRDYSVSFSDYKKVGLGKVIVVGHSKYYGTAVKTYKILPAKAKIKWAKKGKKKFKVKYVSQKKSGITGYQISYAKKGAEAQYAYAGYKTVKKTVKGLKKGKYYVKVRAYKTVGNEVLYGAWSKTKRVRVR